MRTIQIDERDFASADQLMAFLACELEFPAYFGGNLRALNDCLGDLCEPTRIKVRRRYGGAGTWFERTTLILMRAACENNNLQVRIRVG